VDLPPERRRALEDEPPRVEADLVHGAVFLQHDKPAGRLRERRDVSRLEQDVDTDKPVSGYSLRVLRKSMGEFASDLDEYLRRPDLVRDATGKPDVVK
jgi:hypothetical protein